MRDEPTAPDFQADPRPAPMQCFWRKVQVYILSGHQPGHRFPTGSSLAAIARHMAQPLVLAVWIWVLDWQLTAWVLKLLSLAAWVLGLELLLSPAATLAQLEPLMACHWAASMKGTLAAEPILWCRE